MKKLIAIALFAIISSVAQAQSQSEAPNWKYVNAIDKLTGKVTGRIAHLVSTNTIKMQNGRESKASISVTGNYPILVVIKVDSSMFQCEKLNQFCKVRVLFEGGEPVATYGDIMNLSSPISIMPGWVNLFIKGFNTSKKFKIEVSLREEGNQVFEFETENVFDVQNLSLK